MAPLTTRYNTPNLTSEHPVMNDGSLTWSEILTLAFRHALDPGRPPWWLSALIRLPQRWDMEQVGFCHYHTGRSSSVVNRCYVLGGTAGPCSGCGGNLLLHQHYLTTNKPIVSKALIVSLMYWSFSQMTICTYILRYSSLDQPSPASNTHL